MRKVEFVPFRLSDKADIFSIRINNNKKTELNEFLITFHRSDIAQLKKDFDEILKVLDWELSILERDGLDLHTELFNLTIYI